MNHVVPYVIAYGCFGVACMVLLIALPCERHMIIRVRCIMCNNIMMYDTSAEKAGSRMAALAAQRAPSADSACA